VEWITVGRVATAPARGMWRWLKRLTADRQAFLREGSEVVTPVSEFIRKAGPQVTAFGSDGEVKAQIVALEQRWGRLRPKFLGYVNQHPSRKVGQLGNEIAEDVERTFSQASSLRQSPPGSSSDSAHRF
jgi:hypothetical protein